MDSKKTNNNKKYTFKINVTNLPAEVARASVSDVRGTPPLGGVPGISRREETPRKTQDTLE